LKNPDSHSQPDETHFKKSQNQETAVQNCEKPCYTNILPRHASSMSSAGTRVAAKVGQGDCLPF
jgi:hypothetical protein